MEYEYHRIANIFPLMEGDEFKRLVDDIRANGLLESVVLYEEQILDGRNRYRACLEAGVEPRFTDFGGTNPLSYVISKNRHRRHLTSSQLAAIAVQQEELMQELAAAARARQATSEPGVYGGKPLIQTFVEAVDKGTTEQKAAEIFGTNRQYVQDAKRLKENAPDLLAEVAEGKRTMPEAKKEHRKRKRAKLKEQAQAVDMSLAEPIEIALQVKAEAGNWYRLGSHLLYCGDTSSAKFTDALPNASFAFADPPYNAGVAEWDTAFTWAHDWLIDKAPIVAVTPGIASIFEFARATAMPYIWSQACWLDNGMTRGALGFGNWIYIALFSHKSLYRNAQDFIRASIKASENGETAHKGRKPSELIAVLLNTFTNEGDTVIDPFLGSGTTLFVSEQIGRRCVGGEINPEYCEDIIRRWQEMTGLLAERAA